MENFINTMTLKISDYELTYLDSKNQIIFNCYTDIINEFHSNLYKSENIYSEFIVFIDDILKKISNETNYEDNININELINNDEEIFNIINNDNFQKFLN